MTIRSSDYLQTQLRLRTRLEELREQNLGDETLTPDSGWDYFERQRSYERIQELRQEIADVSDDMEWVFDGRGVYGESIAMKRLQSLIEPLGQTMRWTGRDLIMAQGGVSAGAPTTQLVEPVIVGTVSGSFGIRIARAPVAEQVTLFGGSIFDLTAAFVVGVFETARDNLDQHIIREELLGLRQNALAGFRKLALRLAESGEPTRIRWQRDTVVAVDVRTAERLAETLGSVEAGAETRVLQGVLPGGDISDGRFHLVVETDEGTIQYRGDVAEDVVDGLRAIQYGGRVEATVNVLFTDSPLREDPVEDYVLVDIHSLEDGM